MPPLPLPLPYCTTAGSLPACVCASLLCQQTRPSKGISHVKLYVSLPRCHSSPGPFSSAAHHRFLCGIDDSRHTVTKWRQSVICHPPPRRCLTEPRWLAFFHSLLLVNLDTRSFFRVGLKGSACEHLAEQNKLLWNIVSGTFLYFEVRPFTGSSCSTCKFGQNLTAPPPMFT